MPGNKIKRWHVMSNLARYYGLKTYVEVGIKHGNMMGQMLKRVPGLHATAVDPWEATEAYAHWSDEDHRLNEKRFDWLLGKWPKRIKKMKMYSHEAARRFDDDSLDLVFLDGDHSYEAVRLDIAAWLPKVRPGGVISGHDYDNTYKYGDKFKGVDRAVHEAFGEDFSIEPDHVWWVRIPRS